MMIINNDGVVSFVFAHNVVTVTTILLAAVILFAPLAGADKSSLNSLDVGNDDFQVRTTNLPTGFVGFSYTRARVNQKSRFIHFLREVRFPDHQ